MFAIRAKRASLNDFDRFSVMINKKQKAFKLRKLAKMMDKGSSKAAKGKGKK